MILNSPYITGSLTVTGNANIQGALTVTGSLSGTAATSSFALTLQGTGSVGFATTGAFSATSGSASSRLTQIEQVYATTGSNSFRATQSITGSLTVTGQIIAQTLNVQQVTSSIVYSSGSNVFGCDINSRQVFTGSFYQTGSVASFSTCVGIGTVAPSYQLDMTGGTTVNQRIRLQRGSDDTNQNMLLGWNNITVTRSNLSIGSSQTDFSIIQCGSDGARVPFYINVAGQTCISCTLILGNPGCNFELGNDAGGAYIENHGCTAAKSVIRIQSSKSNDALNYAQLLIDPYCGFIFKSQNGGNGNVGIGGINSPVSKLHIYKCANGGCIGKNADSALLIDSVDYGAGTYPAQITFGYFTGTFTYSPVAIGFLPQNGSGAGYADLAFYTRASGTDIAPSERLRIARAGDADIRIGGDYSFHATNNRGTVNINGTSNAMLSFSTGASSPKGYIYHNGDYMELWNSAGSYTAIAANNGEKMRISCNGFSHFGNTGAYVNGNNTVYHTFDSDSAGNSILYFYHRSATGNGLFTNVQACNTTQYTFQGYSDPYGPMAFIYSNGTFGSRTNVYSTIVSDVRCKTEICDAASQWTDIKNLKVRNFKLIEDVEKDPENALRQIGFIAQEVEQVSPGLVFESSDACVDSQPWKNVKTSIIYIKAVKALQEAMCRIEILESCLGIA